MPLANVKQNSTPKDTDMKYTLITATGKLYTFYVKAVAETYQQAYGGTLITGDILVDTTAQTVYN